MVRQIIQRLIPLEPLRIRLTFVISAVVVMQIATMEPRSRRGLHADAIRSTSLKHMGSSDIEWSARLRSQVVGISDMEEA